MRPATTYPTTTTPAHPSRVSRASATTGALRLQRLAASALAVTAVLAAGDTVLTVREVCSEAGFYEANPLVALLIRSTGSVWALLLFKAGLCVPAFVCLYRQRRRWSARIGTALVLTAHLGLALVWTQYLLVTSGVPAADSDRQVGRHPAYVQIAE